MNILSKFRNKHVWNNAELQNKSAMYDKVSIVSMILIIISAWLSPQYIPEYAKAVTLGFVGLAILFMGLSWYTEKQDNKHALLPNENQDENNNQEN